MAAFAGLLFAGIGCSTPPPLDDAQLVSVQAATAEDQVRQAAAREIWAREMFGGATINDPQRGIVEFAPGDYDSYQAYVQQNPHLLPALARPSVDWPELRILFRTRRLLVKSDEANVQNAVYFCDGGPALGNRLFGGELMWRRRFITRAVATEIEAALAVTSEPQEYEISVSYTYWMEREWPRPVSTVTLMAPPGDLCMGLKKSHWPVSVTYGRPLRISRETIAAALGPLPRRLTHRCQDGQLRLEC